MRTIALLLFAILIGLAPSRAAADDVSHPEDESRMRAGLHVVVDVENHTVTLRDGERVIWNTPAGTGTGLRLEDDDRVWNFDTPTGQFTVQHTELNPVWNRPDWFFLQRGQAIPPRGAPERRDPMALGQAAVYLSRGLAIHGTYLPELLGRAVSHGCIRISNEYAVRLYHAVRRGTPVFIEGEAHPIERAIVQPPVSERPEWDPIGEGGTGEWVGRMYNTLEDGHDGWAEATLRLVNRAVEGDGAAASALLIRSVQRFDDPAVEAEFAAYLVNFYDRRSSAFLRTADDLPRHVRERVARTLVTASMRAFGGTLDGLAPWPSRRLPGASAESATADLILAIEEEHRARAAR